VLKDKGYIFPEFCFIGNFARPLIEPSMSRKGLSEDFVFFFPGGPTGLLIATTVVVLVETVIIAANCSGHGHQTRPLRGRKAKDTKAEIKVASTASMFRNLMGYEAKQKSLVLSKKFKCQCYIF